ncbi:winged helix-turn-helix domain-containing protein [Enterobacter cloacae]|uniref:winged helix-turn-helix domain-containing protein n=1 Tax=Enterobacter cloacae TaxID=550 RepID=UPI002DBDFE84|nr:winged helix-turn-helix domain-containing protein [Enterobacter cloacae]MEB7116583.1 winged helix-turn-helix domain-containing protein [Enterobacter cloacae]
MQYLLDGIVHYNDESRILTDNKREVELSLATSRLLNALIDANNSQVSRTELLEKVWEEHGLVASDNNLNRNISLLRKAFLEFSGNDSNLLIVFYVQIMPDDFVMQLHRF